MARKIFSEIIGKTIDSVTLNKDNNFIIFKFDDGTVYSMRHEQHCCERVVIEQVDGDLSDLEGLPLVMAEVETGGDRMLSLWTFYKFATAKGYVTVRWSGESNGYYGVEVVFGHDR